MFTRSLERSSSADVIAREENRIDYLRVAVWLFAVVFCGGFWVAVLGVVWMAMN